MQKFRLILLRVMYGATVLVAGAVGVITLLSPDTIVDGRVYDPVTIGLAGSVALANVTMTEPALIVAVPAE